jgi:hypothetical protein
LLVGIQNAAQSMATPAILCGVMMPNSKNLIVVATYKTTITQAYAYETRPKIKHPKHKKENPNHDPKFNPRSNKNVLPFAWHHIYTSLCTCL